MRAEFASAGARDERFRPSNLALGPETANHERLAPAGCRGP